MKKLGNNELKQITGGINIGIIGLIGAGIAFLIGIFDGYTRPLACH